MIVLMLNFACVTPDQKGVDSFAPSDEPVEAVDKEPVELDEATHARSKACYLDNDWTGSTGSSNCYAWESDFATSWTYSSSTSWEYYYDDVEYTTSDDSEWGYYWTAPGNGTATFYAWVPSNHATGDANYYYYCAYSSSDVYAKDKKVNQNDYYGDWVKLGSRTATSGYTCGVILTKHDDATSSEQIAADGMKIVFSY